MFNTLFYKPLYNGLVYIIDIIPNHDAGIAVVLLTLIVSIILFSISKKSIRTQIVLKEIEPELKAIKEKTKDPTEQARQTMDLYKKYRINPFSIILLMLIQFPILIALYYVFFQGLPTIHTEYLYSFIKNPDTVNMVFLGIVDIGNKSIILAFLAGITQYVQAHIMSLKIQKTDPNKKKTIQEEFAHSMQMQIKYVLPFVVGVIATTLPGALPLYWTVRNIFTVFQEMYVQKSMKSK